MGCGHQVSLLCTNSSSANTDLPPATASTQTKRNLAFANMGLTRLKELKGYPCGRFS